MRHQGKACHRRYTAGGPREDARTMRYYREFARGIGNSRVVIGFEPDSLGTIDCLAKSRRKARIATLRYGVDVLSQLPNATIYIEAGASDWESPGRTAKLLRQVGVAKVRGFMLNVTHYDWTANNINARQPTISRLVGGKHFIVSTSFNGRGPVHYRRWINRRKHLWRRVTVWCHPLKRGLGIAPTTQTNHPLADGYFYIGRPGFSGGSCNGGPLPIGSWFGDRAVMFGQYATNWLRPPAGTKFGHPRGLSLKAFAGDQLSAEPDSLRRSRTVRAAPRTYHGAGSLGGVSYSGDDVPPQLAHGGGGPAGPRRDLLGQAAPCGLPGFQACEEPQPPPSQAAPSADRRSPTPRCRAAWTSTPVPIAAGSTRAHRTR